MQGTKKAYRAPHFRGNSSADFHDILHPDFDDCSVPLVWWPWWPFNPGDFFLSSLAPFHAMLTAGVIDENIRYTPVMEGLASPGYFQWYFDPITNFPVSPQHHRIRPGPVSHELLSVTHLSFLVSPFQVVGSLAGHQRASCCCKSLHRANGVRIICGQVCVYLRSASSSHMHLQAGTFLLLYTSHHDTQML